MYNYFELFPNFFIIKKRKKHTLDDRYSLIKYWSISRLYLANLLDVFI